MVVSSMDNLITQLLNYALFNKHIAVHTASLSPKTPCAADPSKHTIIINTNWHTKKELPLQIAHEIGHVLNEDEGVLYYSTTASHNSIEYAASQTGINILVNLYFKDVPAGDANLNTFVKQLAIPSYMEPYTENCIKHFYNK